MNGFFPFYDDDNDYNVNAPSFYDYLARQQKLIEKLAKRIWEYDKVLAAKLEEINQTLTDYLNQWDENLKQFPENVETLLKEWLSDGTLDQIINETLFNKKAEKTGASYVDGILDLMGTSHAYVTPATNGFNLYVNIDNLDNPIIRYQFRYNDDNLLLLRGIFTGKTRGVDNPTINTNGTFIETSNPINYTVTPGDSFTFNFTGTGFDMYTRRENRGGLWEFTLSNGEKRLISLYNDEQEQLYIPVFNDLPLKKYTGKAVFLGSDPNHVIENARGYIFYDTTNNDYVSLRVHNTNQLADESTMIQLVSTSTINDFAISAKKEGATYGTEWVPQHGSVNNVSLDINYKLYVNGRLINDLLGKTLNETIYDVKDLEIIQRFNATNPNESGTLWRHTIRHSFKISEPVLTIQNGMDFITNTQIGNLYTAMLGVSTDNVNRLVYNNGFERIGLPKDGSTSTAEEGVTSAMYVGMYEDGRYHAAGIDVRSIWDATGRDNPNNPPIYNTFRPDGVTKFYIKGYKDGDVIPAGTRLNNTQRIGVITGIRNPNDWLGSIT